MTDFLDVKRGEITERLKELAGGRRVPPPRGRRVGARQRGCVGLQRRAPPPPPRPPPPWTGTPARLRQKSGRPDPGSGCGFGRRRDPQSGAQKSGPSPRIREKSRPSPRLRQKSGPPPRHRQKSWSSPRLGEKSRPSRRRKKSAVPPAKKVGRPAGLAGRPDGAKAAARAPPRRSRFVQGQPGITIPELAAKMGIKQNYLYRVLPGLEQEGKLEKKGRGWHPKG